MLNRRTSDSAPVRIPPAIVGYAARYYDPRDPGTETRLDTNVYERILPGAFDGVLSRGDDVRALLNHNPDKVLGRTSAGTLRLFTDKRGLRFELNPPPNQLGKVVTDAVRRADITGASFGFQADDQNWRTEKRGDRIVSVREIRAVTLADISLATYPAYRAPEVNVSEATTPALNTRKRRMQAGV